MAKPALTTDDIRRDIVTRLDALPGITVYDSRVLDADADELPAISVLSSGSTETIKSVTGLITMRVDRFLVQSMVKAGSSATFEATLASTIDALQDAIVDVLFADGEWRGAFERTAIVGDVDKWRGKTTSAALVAGVDMTIEVQYSRRPTDASGSLSKLYVVTQTEDPDGADVSDRRML